jgi:hypothetical protein
LRQRADAQLRFRDRIGGFQSPWHIALMEVSCLYSQHDMQTRQHLAESILWERVNERNEFPQNDPQVPVADVIQDHVLNHDGDRMREENIEEASLDPQQRLVQPPRTQLAVPHHDPALDVPLPESGDDGL